MTIAFSPDGYPGAYGNWFSNRAVSGTLTLSGTYAAGAGDAVPDNISPAFRSVSDVVFKDGVLSDGTVARFDPATKRIRLFKSNGTSNLVELSGGAATTGATRVVLAGV